MLKVEAANRLGLARRAGLVVIGEENCLKAIRSRKAFLLVLAEDASANTKKRFRDKCSFYRTPLVEAGNRHELGAAVGRETAVALAVTDQRLADGIQRTISENGGAI